MMLWMLEFTNVTKFRDLGLRVNADHLDFSKKNFSRLFCENLRPIIFYVFLDVDISRNFSSLIE